MSAVIGRTCPSCARDVRPGTRFCTGCGSHLPGAPAGSPIPAPTSLDAPTVSTPAAATPAVPAPRTPPRSTVRATPPTGATPRATAPARATPPPGAIPRATAPVRATPPARPVEPAPSGGTGRGVRLPMGLVIVGAVAVAALILLVGIMAVSRVTPSPATVPAASGPTVSASSDGSGTDVAGTTGATSTDPLTTLRTTATGDVGAVDGVTGSWVAQISAKKPGLVADGQTYDAAAVLADHQRLRAQYPDVRLLWSADYSTYRSPDFWVTIVARPFSDPASANAWCDAQRFATTQCYAKLISHTAGSDDSTRLRTGS